MVHKTGMTIGRLLQLLEIVAEEIFVLSFRFRRQVDDGNSTSLTAENHPSSSEYYRSPVHQQLEH